MHGHGTRPTVDLTALALGTASHTWNLHITMRRVHNVLPLTEEDNQRASYVAVGGTVYFEGVYMAMTWCLT